MKPTFENRSGVGLWSAPSLQAHRLTPAHPHRGPGRETAATRPLLPPLTPPHALPWRRDHTRAHLSVHAHLLPNPRKTQRTCLRPPAASRTPTATHCAKWTLSIFIQPQIQNGHFILAGKRRDISLGNLLCTLRSLCHTFSLPQTHSLHTLGTRTGAGPPAAPTPPHAQG